MFKLGVRCSTPLAVLHVHHEIRGPSGWLLLNQYLGTALGPWELNADCACPLPAAVFGGKGQIVAVFTPVGLAVGCTQL